MPGGIFFEIWPLEKGHALTSHPCGVQTKPGPLGIRLVEPTPRRAPIIYLRTRISIGPYLGEDLLVAEAPQVYGQGGAMRCTYPAPLT